MIQPSESLKHSSTLVLFDFDGTVTRKDSLFDFIIFYRGRIPFYWGMLWLSPAMVLFKLGIIPNWKAKEKVLSYFFAGESVQAFQDKSQAYARQRLPSIIKESALDKIREFQTEGADIYVVSASAENWLIGWCESLGIQLIATQLEVREAKLTGKIAGSNCYGPEKAVRIQGCIDLSQYDKIYGYGDSRGDREMLALAHFPHYRYFKQ